MEYDLKGDGENTGLVSLGTWEMFERNDRYDGGRVSRRIAGRENKTSGEETVRTLRERYGIPRM